jgi:hypothetical protein
MLENALMPSYIRAAILIALLIPVGCKVEIHTPEQGSVISSSGDNDCGPGLVCIVDVMDMFFAEEFTAIPNPGYVFESWKKDKGGYFCGGSSLPCNLSFPDDWVSWGSSDDPMQVNFFNILRDLLADDELAFFVEPQFVELSSKVLAGTLTDSAILGVSFVTATQVGITDAAGTFLFMAGETITFSIGGTVLGEAVAAEALMTPHDLVPGAPLYATGAEVRNASAGEGTAESLLFDRFVNIIVFLQSLDEDADPSNGISIPDGIAELLAGIQIDFDEDTDDFAGSEALRSVLHQAASAGLLSTAAVRKTGAALDHFYGEQLISFVAARLIAASSDVDANGVDDELYTSIYDGDGRLIRVEGDFDGDRDLDYTYDDNGNLTEYAEDDDGDGNPDYIETYAYDGNGNLTEYAKDNDGVGNPSHVETYNYNDDGYQNRWTIDSDGDGTIDYIEHRTFDAEGSRISTSKDFDGDGIPDYVETYTYDDNGYRNSWTTDSDGDGATDRIEYRTFDAAGNGLTLEQDEDGDGTIDHWEDYTYDADGNWIGTIAYEEEDVPVSTATRTYNENGNLLSFSSDFDADGNPNHVETYTYDDNDNWTGWSADYGGDGNLDYSETHTFDADSNLTYSAYDYDGDGDTEETGTWTYDADGNQTSYSRIFDGDDNTDFAQYWTYDADSKVTSYSKDLNHDGFVDYIETSTYDTDGNEVEYTEDYDGDGEPELIETSVYDNNGNWTSLIGDDEDD